MQNFIQIEELTAPELEVYSGMSEVQLRRIYEPEPGIFIAESPKVITRALDAGYEPLSLLLDVHQITEEAQILLERCGDVPIYTAGRDVLIRLTGFQLTRGALCAMRRLPHPDTEIICKTARRIAVLENVVNPTNVGAIFRSAAALGIDAVLLTTGCSDPFYRRAARVSMGTVFQIPWTYIQNMDILKEMGFRTAAMALSENAVFVDDPALMAEPKLAIILGTEGEGLAEKTIKQCDYTVCIPMSNGVDSLNVAAASAVAFWQLGNKRN